jgi:uroporphyrinogen-III synthase
VTASSGPLTGKVILVTRPPDQATGLAIELRGLGATAIEAPTIRIEQPPPGAPLDDATRDAAAGRYAWVVFTSAAGVAAWFDRNEATGRPGPQASVAAVGDGTADALRERNVIPDLVPRTFTTAALGEEFPRGSGEILLARADRAGRELAETLRAKGWTPVPVEAYRTRLADSLPDDALRELEAGRVDAVAFTSASTVEGFVRTAGHSKRPPAVCIGPVTAEAARAAGFEIAAVADPHTVNGLVEALRRALE